MSLLHSHNRVTAAATIDALLQDSYLLVVELYQGRPVDNIKDLIALCTEQITHVRQQLSDAGMSQRSIDQISHAQCALLDETVLTQGGTDTNTSWADQPLQARFFGRYQAGEALYEEMRERLREPAPDLHVLTVFQRVLMLGFKGRYTHLNDPEREQLLAALDERVAPLDLDQRLKTQTSPRRWTRAWRRVRTSLGHSLAVVLVVALIWWGLDLALGNLVVSLTSGLE